MDHTKLIIIVLIVMALLCAGILFVFKQYMNHNIMDGPGMVNENTDYHIYKTDNVLELAAWLGKSAEEAGIEEKYVQSENNFFKVAFDGKLFDAAAHGEVWFEYSDEVVKRVETVYIHTSELTYDECKTKLSELYGESGDEYEEPYVEVNGGAVTHCTFNAEGYTVKLSSASERDYIDITISK